MLTVFNSSASAKITMRWARADYKGIIYSSPDGEIKPSGKQGLWYLTEDYYPEVYRVCDDPFIDSQGREWVRVGLLVRPNGQLHQNLGDIYSSRLLLTCGSDTVALAIPKKTIRAAELTRSCL